MVKCKSCDQLNFDFNCDFCDECQSRFRAIIAQYLSKFPKATIIDLVSDTEVPSLLVMKWANAGQIRYVKLNETHFSLWWEQPELLSKSKNG